MRLPFPTGTDRIRSLVIFSVFALFAANALGLLDFSAVLRGGPALNTQLLDELMHGRLPASLRRIEVVGFLLLGVVLALLLPVLPPVGASLVTLLATIPPFYTAWHYPTPPSLVPLEYTLLTILMLFSVNVLSAYFAETHARQKIITAFGQYVPPSLVGEISRRPEAFSMAAETREMSVLFCDIKKFTTLAEALDARDLGLLLNDYLTAMTDVLQAHGATIDKYIGDAIMAFWSAPVIQTDHAARAVTAALAMQRRMAAVRATFVARDWPPIEVGIGIASGMMNVGNMGSRYRIAYTVIGDAVNLAARIEALTRLYGVDILVSTATRAACDTVRYREIDYVRVKGKAAAQRIYQPVPHGACDDASLAAHAEGLDAYYAADWQLAAARFGALQAAGENPHYYAVMLDRMATQAPPRGWDGIVSYGSESSYSLAGSAADDADPA